MLLLHLPCTYIVRPPSLARRSSPAAGLVGCAQQCQQVRTAVTYQAANAVTYVVLGVACVGSTFCSPLKMTRIPDAHSRSNNRTTTIYSQQKQQQMAQQQYQQHAAAAAPRQRGMPATSERASYRPFDNPLPSWLRVVGVCNVCSVVVRHVAVRCLRTTRICCTVHFLLLQ